MSIVIRVLLAVFLLLGPHAVADDRVGVEVEQVPGGARVHGHVGAYGFDNTYADGQLYNPPLNGSIGRNGQQYDETFGPPVAHATAGTGGITAGWDEAGRLTGLSWPGPGLYDHVSYLNFTRGYPNKGAPENAGSFGGVGTSWLTTWAPVSQAYASDLTETLVTELEGPGGARATITDVVDPASDVVARNFRVPGDFVHYAQMNPTTSRAPRTPSIFDGAADNFSDFGTMWDAGASAMVHFRPYTADPGGLDAGATGVYIAIGGQSAATEFQAGLVAAGLVRDEAEGTPLLDPFYDIADGHLSGSPVALGKSAGAFKPVADPDGSYTVYLTAASSSEGALELLQAARARGFAAIRAASDAWWDAWISRARLPATLDAQTLAVSRRALMVIRTAQDRITGAIVANTTVQTPYRQDWVRDGAFFNYALLLAGYPEMAVQHADFYRGLYRPGGTWDSLYFTDGAEAGFIYPYEIDSQAFALWALWLPYEFGAGDSDYLRRMWVSIRDTADALLLCRDPSNGLQCRAAEDDAVVPSQGTQGASTVYLALRSAAEAARVLGEDGARWDARADELRAAALARLCPLDRCQGGRGGVYMVWPGRVLEPGSPKLQSHLAQYVSELDSRSSFASPPPGGSLQYPMESILALAPFWTGADRDARLTGWVRWLANDVAEPGVLHYGERIFRCDGASPCLPGHRYLHSVGFPHIWSGAELYIAAAFVHGLAGCAAGTRVGEAPCRG